MTTGAVDWDKQPPTPYEQYEQSARQVNVGYELIFTLSTALLRGLGKDDLELLVVGAGGGMEVGTFGAANPGWRITGVDPAANMLALAQSKVDALGLGDRVALVRGTTDDLPTGARFDAATCILVMQLLEDERLKLDLLQGIATHLRPGAPLILVSRVSDNLDHFVAGWQQYGESLGAPADEVAAAIARVSGRRGISEERHVALLREAGFTSITRFFGAFSLAGWIAR